MGRSKNKKSSSPTPPVETRRQSDTLPAYQWNIIAILLFTTATVLMFSHIIFSRENLVISSETTDLFSQFVHWRYFGFNEIKNGNFPLWNPHIYSGTPYFGGFQSALLYPLNIFFVLFDLDTAINLSIIVHVILAGVFVFFWTRFWKLHPIACILSSFIFMFCGAFYLHVDAGHLPNLSTMIWAPLIFLCIDGILHTRKWMWVFIGIIGVTFQILAGHPQYVFMTALASGLYCLFNFKLIKKYKITLLMFGLIGAGAALISAIQLITGWYATKETVRSVGISFAQAAGFAFPIENLMTMLNPFFFGDDIKSAYWGAGNIWEMNIFEGIGGLTFAAYGILTKKNSHQKICIALVVLLFVVALGNQTPLFKILFDYFPLFNKFRGMSKFNFLVSLFITMLIAYGCHAFIHAKSLNPKLYFGFFMVACLGLIAGMLLYSGKVQFPLDLIRKIIPPGTTMETVANEGSETFKKIVQTNQFTAKGFFWMGIAFLLTGGVMWSARYFPRAKFLLIGLSLVEILIFAHHFTRFFTLEDAQFKQLGQKLQPNANKSRIFHANKPNSAMTINAYDIWGYDPGVLLRYAQFIAVTQGVHPDAASQFVSFHKLHPLFKMLRLKYLYTPGPDGVEHLKTLSSNFPRYYLVKKHQVIQKRDQLLTYMLSRRFDPRKIVLLETNPKISPHINPNDESDPGTVTLLNETSDEMHFEATLNTAAFLIITDNYARGWHVLPEITTSQKTYQVLPGNYILRCIPLNKGNHKFRLVYDPLPFRIGKWISLISLLVYFSILGAYTWKKSAG